MVSVIRAIVLSAIAQVVLLATLISYLFVHTDGTAQAYALLTEQSAAHYTDEAVRDQYNLLQVERSQEREDIHAWVDKRIDLKISQAMKEK